MDAATKDITKALNELTQVVTRVDERIESIATRQEEMRESIHNLRDHQQTLNNRVAILESRKIEQIAETVQRLELRIGLVEKDTNSQGKRWEKIADVVFKLVAGIALAGLLLKLGLH